MSSSSPVSPVGSFENLHTDAVTAGTYNPNFDLALFDSLLMPPPSAPPAAATLSVPVYSTTHFIEFMQSLCKNYRNWQTAKNNTASEGLRGMLDLLIESQHKLINYLRTKLGPEGSAEITRLLTRFNAAGGSTAASKKKARRSY